MTTTEKLSEKPLDEQQSIKIRNENNVISNKINSVITVPKIETTYNSVNLYQPLLFSVIAILLIVVVIMFITIRRKSSQTKEEASSDRLLKYESEERLLQSELQKVNTENVKLEKQIEHKRKEQMGIALSIIQKNQFFQAKLFLPFYLSFLVFK